MLDGRRFNVNQSTGTWYTGERKIENSTRIVSFTADRDRLWMTFVASAKLDSGYHREAHLIIFVVGQVFGTMLCRLGRLIIRALRRPRQVFLLDRQNARVMDNLDPVSPLCTIDSSLVKRLASRGEFFLCNAWEMLHMFNDSKRQ
jgi:hypothetical protein